MKEYLILDGYNVINSWPKLKFLMNESLEIAREELINIMAEYRAFKGINVIVVFDAYLVKGSMRSSEKLKGVEIVFTKERQTADAYIERLIIGLVAKRNRVAVVTNDFTEQQMVLGGGATRIPVREMILEYSEIKNKINRKIEANKVQKNTLSDRIDSSILEKLEKLRRGQ